ncbi:hypothetical protein VP01_4543g2 [Puccinia sorghi]|uniref:Uncharacterized protein n=1 Tax=Puccinia sorghi TaxID=27349 RepID=A0A0L6UQU0_9BASI|nr:hypothetical protein VP01_4543g2 [Puccinia sorghi]
MSRKEKKFQQITGFVEKKKSRKSKQSYYNSLHPNFLFIYLPSPAYLKPKGNPNKPRTTTRDPTAFEIMEKIRREENQRRRPK